MLWHLGYHIQASLLLYHVILIGQPAHDDAITLESQETK
jgi:hypothetical protein